MWPPPPRYSFMNLERNKLLRIEELSLGLDESENLLKSKAASALGLLENEIRNITVVKRAIDSRNKRRITFVYSVVVEVEDLKKIKVWEGRHRIKEHTPFVYRISKALKSPKNRPVIIGSGPCG